jgi:hypothetical protein
MKVVVWTRASLCCYRSSFASTVMLMLLLCAVMMDTSSAALRNNRQEYTRNKEEENKSKQHRQVSSFLSQGRELDSRELKSVKNEKATEFSSDPHAVQDRGASLQTLDDLKYTLANSHEDATLPFYMDAADVPGAEPYVYKGFDIRPIYFEGIPYQGECTLVFAWLSTPVNVDIDEGSNEGITPPVTMTPGMVLLHGGGGTAHKTWVERWAMEGFSAIAMGLEGQTDTPISDEGVIQGKSKYSSTPYPGPRRNGIYRDCCDRPLQDQWMFHAVATSMLANTLLQSQPEVNRDQVGVVGVSWGGVVAATFLPFDSRYAFAIIGYASGSLTGTTEMDLDVGSIGRRFKQHGPEAAAFYERQWDPSPRLSSVKTPTLWISSPTELNFSIKSQAATISSLHPQAPVWVSNIPGLLHGTHAIYVRPENYVFARAVIDSAANSNDQHNNSLGVQVPSLIQAQQTGQHFMSRTNDAGNNVTMFTATFRLPQPPRKVSLVWSDTLFECSTAMECEQREWHESTVDVVHMDADIASNDVQAADGRPLVLFRVEQGFCDSDSTQDPTVMMEPSCLYSITVSLPLQTTSWYINVHMENDAIVSSQYNEMNA